MDLIRRAEWGARAPRHISRAQLTGASTGHWNGPGIPDVDHSRCASLVRGIQNFHMDGRGWSDIAYNFVICPHGYVFEGRGLDVINGANGTNAANRSSHAVMWMAGEGDPFHEEEKASFRECVKYISDETLAPDSAIGHRDHKSTACPGDERYNWIHQGMPTTGVVPQPSIPEEEDMPSSNPVTILDKNTAPRKWTFYASKRSPHGEDVPEVRIWARLEDPKANPTVSWYDLGGACLSGPSAAVRDNGEIMIQVVGVDGMLYEKYLPVGGAHGDWSEWYAIGGSVTTW